jgi:hypothetical protein
MISKMDECRKLMNVDTEKGRKNNWRLRNELTRATDNAKKECHENIFNKIMDFQRTGRYDFIYMKTKNRLEGDPRDPKYWHRRFPSE